MTNQQKLDIPIKLLNNNKNQDIRHAKNIPT